MKRIIFVFLAVICVIVSAENYGPSPQPTKTPVTTGPVIGGTCPAPTPEMLRCLRQYACQYIIRLDLRCLLNLNGNPLLGGLLSNGQPATGLGGNTGLLGGILGL